MTSNCSFRTKAQEITKEVFLDFHDVYVNKNGLFLSSLKGQLPKTMSVTYQILVYIILLRSCQRMHLDGHDLRKQLQ